MDGQRQTHRTLARRSLTGCASCRSGSRSRSRSLQRRRTVLCCDGKGSATSTPRTSPNTGGEGDGGVTSQWERGWGNAGYWSVKDGANRQNKRKSDNTKSRGNADTKESSSSKGTGVGSSFIANRKKSFSSLGMSDDISRSLELEGLSRPTRIQSLSFDDVAEGANVAILAETGSGKTYAYALPLMCRLRSSARRMKGGVSGKIAPAVLVMVPTEELATQAGMMMSKAAAWIIPPKNAKFDGEDFNYGAIERTSEINVSVLTGKSKKLLRPRHETAKSLFGKSSSEAKRKKTAKRLSGDAAEEAESGRRALESSQIIVATPAWILKLTKSDYIVADRLQAIVIDEADEMLSSGFHDSVLNMMLLLMKNAANSVKREKADLGTVQVILAAATMPRTLACKLESMLDEKLITVASAGLHRMPRGLHHDFISVYGDEGRKSALSDILHVVVTENKEQVLVFTNSPEECEDLAAFLKTDGFSVISFHGRGKRAAGSLDSFSLGGISVLVSTDVAARGIDFPLLRYVVEYRPAKNLRTHVHRIGRTARAGQKGPFYSKTLIDTTNSKETTIQKSIISSLHQ